MKEMICDRSKSEDKKDDKKKKDKDLKAFDSTPPGRKRKRKARSSRKQMKPRRLFHEDGDTQEAEEPSRQEQEATEAEREENLSQSPDCRSEEPESEDAGSENEDNDVFGGNFTLTTPSRPPSAASSKRAPPSKVKSTPGDVSDETSKIMKEVDLLCKEVDKRLLDCLPSQANPHTGCTYTHP